MLKSLAILLTSMAACVDGAARVHHARADKLLAEKELTEQIVDESAARNRVARILDAIQRGIQLGGAFCHEVDKARFRALEAERMRIDNVRAQARSDNPCIFCGQGYSPLGDSLPADEAEHADARAYDAWCDAQEAQSLAPVRPAPLAPVRPAPLAPVRAAPLVSCSSGRDAGADAGGNAAA